MKIRITLETLYWIGYSFIVFADMFVNVKYLGMMTDYIVMTGIVLLLCYILFCHKSYRVNTILFLGITGLGFLYSYSIYQDFTVLRFIILLIASAEIDFNRIIKHDLGLKLFFLLVVMSLSVMGMCQNTIFIRGNQIRYTLGFIHPNTAGFYIMTTMMEYIYIHREKLKRLHFAIIVLVGIFVWTVTGARGSMVAIIILFAGLIVQKIGNDHYYLEKVGKHIIQYIFPYITLSVLLFIWAYDIGLPWALRLNEIISFRLQYFTYYYKNYSINLLGNPVNFYNGVLDNAYLMLLINYGVIAYGLYCILYCRKMKELYVKKDYPYIVILMALAMYGMMENTIIKAAYNVFLMSFTSVLFKKQYRAIPQKEHL